MFLSGQCYKRGETHEWKVGHLEGISPGNRGLLEGKEGKGVMLCFLTRDKQIHNKG